MKTTTLLSAVLVAQLVMAAGIGWYKYSAGRGIEPQALLDFAISDVDGIEIEDTANTAVLTRSGDHWTLPVAHGLAANQSRVTRLLDDLAALETGWPVATTASSIERLEVDENSFQRRLRLKAGDRVLGEYYFGTSPGLRQTHGRRAGEAAVYALAINNFDMPGDDNDWLDKTLLAAADITRLSGDGFTLVHEEDAWRFDHLENGERLDTAKVDTLVAALENLRVLRVTDSLPDTEPVTLTVGGPERRWTYTFYAQDDKYYVGRDDMEAVFTISKTSYDRIAGVKRQALLEEVETVEEESTADEAAV